MEVFPGETPRAAPAAAPVEDDPNEGEEDFPGPSLSLRPAPEKDTTRAAAAASAAPPIGGGEADGCIPPAAAAAAEAEEGGNREIPGDVVNAADRARFAALSPLSPLGLLPAAGRLSPLLAPEGPLPKALPPMSTISSSSKTMGFEEVPSPRRETELSNPLTPLLLLLTAAAAPAAPPFL